MIKMPIKNISIFDKTRFYYFLS